MTLVDPFELDRRIVDQGGLYHFMRLAWPHVVSSPYVDGWHIEEMCAHLEAVSRGDIDRLVINVPPGTSKSSTVCVFWQAWDWIYRSWHMFMFVSFDHMLTMRDARLCKELIDSCWYQQRWGLQADHQKLEAEGKHPVFVMKEPKQNTATLYYSSGGGKRLSTSMEGKATGHHSHIQVFDDPTKPKSIQDGGKTAAEALARTIETYRSTFATRKADPKHFARVIIMQRLHENDLSGYALAEEGYEHLRLPMEYDASRPCKTSIGGDRRTVDGELLCPERFDAKAVETTKKDLGPIASAAQLDQDPSPAAGAIFQRDWFNNRWQTLPAGCQWLQSWDCTFKDADDSDFVVGQVWAYKGAEFFLVDQIRERMDLPTTCQALIDLSTRYTMARKKLIEDKANGPAVEQTLRKKVPGIILVNPEGGKVSRANAVTALFQTGNVYLPEGKAWLKDYVDELAKFPKAKNDDQVDATTQALVHLTAKPRDRFKEAMAKARI